MYIMTTNSITIISGRFRRVRNAKALRLLRGGRVDRRGGTIVVIMINNTNSINSNSDITFR